MLPFSFGEDDHHTPGTHVQTICIVGEGDLPLELSWTFRGLPPTAGEFGMADMGISTTKVGPRSSVLQIDSVTAAHSGEYTCTAKNAVGSQSYSAHLEVLGIDSVISFINHSEYPILHRKRARPISNEI